MDHQPTLFLVTGSRGAGKSSFCAALAQAARAAGWDVAGLLSYPVFEGNHRTAIETEDLATGEVRQLAAHTATPSPGTHHWNFDDDVIDWGNTVLQQSLPCDLLVIDELGPLEFDLDRGWQAAFSAIETGQYAVAVVVVRAELLATALTRWQAAEIIEIDTPEESERKAAVLSEALFG